MGPAGRVVAIALNTRGLRRRGRARRAIEAAAAETGLPAPTDPGALRRRARASRCAGTARRRCLEARVSAPSPPMSTSRCATGRPRGCGPCPRRRARAARVPRRALARTRAGCATSRSASTSTRPRMAAAAGDRPEGYGLIVTTGAEERVVAHAVFEVERPDRAEVAFAVADEMQGRGLATVLIAHLAQVASARGVTHLHRDRAAREPAHDQRLPRVRASRSTCAPRRTGSSSSSRPSWARTRGASSRIATGSPPSPRSSGCCGRARWR